MNFIQSMDAGLNHWVRALAVDHSKVLKYDYLMILFYSFLTIYLLLLLLVSFVFIRIKFTVARIMQSTCGTLLDCLNLMQR